MPISATGRAEGFTLVELLIVLTILGLLSAAVVIALPDARGSVREEALRFAARVGQARDRAVIEARPVAVRVTADGYAFERRRGREWQPVETIAWDDEVAPEGDALLLFDPTGLADPAQVVLERDGARAIIDVAADGKVLVDG